MTRIPLVAPLAVVALWATCIAREDAMQRYIQVQIYEGLIVIPSGETAVWLSLGHRRAFADLLWLRGLIYVGDELANRGDSAFVYDLTRTMTYLDPEFRRAYLWAGVVGLYRVQDVSIDDMMPAVEFLRVAATRFPDDGEIAWELAATLRYEIAPHVADLEHRRALEQEASEHLATAARHGAGPPWLALASSSEFARLGQLERAATHLREMVAIANDADLRDVLLNRLAELEGASEAEAIRVELDLARETTTAEFPWMPFDFAVLLGPKGVVDFRSD